MRTLATLALLLSAALAAPAQTTPRGEAKQARADRRMERAHTIRRGASLSKKPRLVREEDKLDRQKARPRRH